jgi:sec-independent protein translocase protein TatC
MLAIPMTVLFLVSEVIARVVDRRRAGRRESFDDVDDDAPSPLEEDRVDYQRSRLDDEDL